MQRNSTRQLLILLACLTSLHVISQGTYDFGISTMDKVSGATSVLIDLPGTAEYDPEWSPDGSMIAFDIVSPIDPHRVAIANSSGVLLTIFTGAADNANNATWNAAGTMIVVDKEPVGDFSLYTINVATGITNLLVADARDAAFSNKGGSKQFLAFTRPSDGNIYVMNMTTGTMNAITQGENVQWAPNDKALVYSHLGDVYTIDITKTGTAAGPAVLQAGDPLHVESKPAWISPNQIVFHADYSGDFDLYKKRLKGSTTITRVGGNLGLNDYDPDYDNNNDLIAFSEGTAPVPFLSLKRFSNDRSLVFPNPTTGMIHLNLYVEEKDEPTAYLYNIEGTLIMVRKLGKMFPGQYNETLILPAGLIKGNYLLKVVGKVSYLNEKLVVTR